MHGLARQYLRHIDALNQRGGRTLSIVDLILANTLSPGIAAYVAHGVGRGASFLTAANPGGAGKTALLAALLGFLPEDRPIVTIDSPDVLAAAENEAAPSCLLVHEIGAGHWYGYLWGPAVRRYLALTDDRHTVASCLHADTLEELCDVLAAAPIEMERDLLLGIEFILFMRIDGEGRGGAWGCRRRVAAVYESDREAGAHRLVFRWNRTADAFETVGQTFDNPEVRRLTAFLEGLASAGVNEFAEVRQAYLRNLLH